MEEKRTKPRAVFDPTPGDVLVELEELGLSEAFRTSAKQQTRAETPGQAREYG